MLHGAESLGTEKPKRGTWILRVVVTLVFLSFLVAGILWVGPRTLWQTIQSLPISILGAMVALIAFNNLLRALRLRTALSDGSGSARPSVGRLWCVVNVHQFMNYVLPFRSGEFTLVYLGNRFLGCSSAAGLGVLLLVRSFDLMLLGVFFSIGLFWLLWETGNAGGGLLLVSALFAVLMTVFALGLPRWVGVIASRLRARPDLESPGGSLGRRVARLILGVDEQFASQRSWNAKTSVLLLSVAQYCVLFFIFWIVIRGAGISLGIPQVTTGATGAIVGNLLPVNAVGSVGSLEAGWMLGFGLVGLDRGIALATALVFHVVYLAFGAVLAAGSWLILSRTGDGHSA